MKLGFGWYRADEAPDGVLVLAHNLVRDPARARPGQHALPRGLKHSSLWRRRCFDGRRAERVRCSGMKLHRGRHAKFVALAKAKICADPLARKANHLHTGMMRAGRRPRSRGVRRRARAGQEQYVKALNEAARGPASALETERRPSPARAERRSGGLPRRAPRDGAVLPRRAPRDDAASFPGARRAAR